MIDQGWTNAHKNKYDGKCVKVNIIAIWESTYKKVGLR